MKGNAPNLGERRVEAKNSNFNMLYKYKGEESYLVLVMHEYQLINIQYICNIKKIS